MEQQNYAIQSLQDTQHTVGTSTSSCLGDLNRLGDCIDQLMTVLNDASNSGLFALAYDDPKSDIWLPDDHIMLSICTMWPLCYQPGLHAAFYVLVHLYHLAWQVAAMKAGSKAMKAQFKKLNVSQIEDIQDELEDLMEDQNEVCIWKCCSFYHC
jgi:hypothetical protein